MARRALNDADFRDPLFRMGAEGYQWTSDPLPVPMPEKDGFQARNGGISGIARWEMPGGHMYYRLGSLIYKGQAVDPVTYLDSPWWLEFEEFRQIERFAKMSGNSLSTAVRVLAAVPYEWNDCDIVVRAQLMQPLDAYRGAGRSAAGATSRANNRWTTDPKHPLEMYRVSQLYIPGIRLPFRSAFRNPYRGAMRLEELRPI